MHSSFSSLSPFPVLDSSSLPDFLHCSPHIFVLSQRPHLASHRRYECCWQVAHLEYQRRTAVSDDVGSRPVYDALRQPIADGNHDLIVPPIAIVGVFYGRYVRDLSKKTQTALGEITKVAEERIGNIRTVQAFAKEDAEVKRYAMLVGSVFQLA